MESGKRLDNIYDLCKVDSKHFGPAENTAQQMIINKYSVERKDNFFDYYKEEDNGKSRV